MSGANALKVRPVRAVRQSGSTAISLMGSMRSQGETGAKKSEQKKDLLTDVFFIRAALISGICEQGVQNIQVKLHPLSLLFTVMINGQYVITRNTYRWQ